MPGFGPDLLNLSGVENLKTSSLSVTGNSPPAQHAVDERMDFSIKKITGNSSFGSLAP
jgi:hypothetical protein